VGEERGVKLVIDGMKRILRGYKGSTRLLIEISAGAGMVIGDAFEEVRTIMDGVGDERVGVCFDTAHAFASGYDLRTPDAVAATMTAFDKIVGLAHLDVSHCNDSKVDIGERKDRHEHLGKGMIGLGGFKAVVGSSAFAKVNLILETPPEGVADDLAILKRLRK
jgi:apurinic endonuclease APN1